MQYFKTQDLANYVLDAFYNGAPYIGIDLLPDPDTLHFSAVPLDDGIEFAYDDIPACEPDIENPPRIFSAEDYLLHIHFTLDEVETARLAALNAIEYLDKELQSGAISKEDIADAKRVIIDCRNLQAKISHMYKRLFKK